MMFFSKWLIFSPGSFALFSESPFPTATLCLGTANVHVDFFVVNGPFILGVVFVNALDAAC